MKTLKIITQFLFIIILFGCEAAWEENYQVYTIKEGKHFSTYKIASLQSETLMFSAIFNESAIYESPMEENQHDIHKLLGFSECNSHHHDNSARFGWRWLDGQLEIHGYCYVNGTRITEPIGTVDLDQETLFSIHISDTHYTFQINNEDPISMSRGNVCTIGAYYMLWPYFGGDDVAPHDVSIRIKMLY